VSHLTFSPSGEDVAQVGDLVDGVVLRDGDRPPAAEATQAVLEPLQGGVAQLAREGRERQGQLQLQRQVQQRAPRGQPTHTRVHAPRLVRVFHGPATKITITIPVISALPASSTIQVSM